MIDLTSEYLIELDEYGVKQGKTSPIYSVPE